jgi:hypothetical protein
MNIFLFFFQASASIFITKYSSGVGYFRLINYKWREALFTAFRAIRNRILKVIHYRASAQIKCTNTPSIAIFVHSFIVFVEVNR